MCSQLPHPDTSEGSKRSRFYWLLKYILEDGNTKTFDYDGEIYLYPGSPTEADPESIRVKRQAYQVYVGGDVSVTVDKSGQAETGAWGPWTSDQDCSRTCGGGVQIEKRQC
uniref:ADAM_spacer1 domain-containing protein n=1 Tax=Ascaris lumbricoides TaxID=6252 RepID=A0A0M3HLI8_ASCLU